MSGNRGQWTATAYMLGSVLAYSLIPLVIAKSGGVESPFLFNAGWRFGLAAGCVLVVASLYWRVLLNKDVFPIIVRSALTWMMLFATFQAFENALFAWSIKYIDISAANILFETWPIIFIILTAWLLRGGNAYRKNGPTLFLILLVALAGFVFVIFGQAGGLEFEGTRVSGLNKGIALALLAALAASFGAFHIRWGRDLSLKIPETATHGTSAVSLIFMGAILSYAISNVFGVVLNTTIGLSLGETFGGTLGGKAFLIGVAGGFVLHAAGGILFRLSNLVTDNLGINALNYAIPILSLLWLWNLSEIHIPRLDYLLIGATAIIASNLIINFEAEIRWGFKALLLALWVAGVSVYTREEIFAFLGVEKWHWTAGGYFEALALSATVFTLLLAFRVARLIARTGEEENRMFNVFRRLELLVQRDIINAEVLTCVTRMDAPKNIRDVEVAYSEARCYFRQARADSKALRDMDLQLLSEAEANLDTLARSKQQDITAGEMFALFIFAAITVTLALLSRPPEVTGWNRLLVDIFAILISGVIVFLVVNVWDLRRERDERKLVFRETQRDYSVLFSEVRRQSFDQWLSLVVGSAMVFIFAALLAHEWVGWFSWLL